MDLKNYIEKGIRPCIVCESKDLEIFASRDYLTARICKKCGMISTNPYFNEEGISILYSNYLADRLNIEEKSRQREIMYEVDRDWILNFISSGTILDVGCSAGYFLSKFDREYFDRNGVEMSERYVELAKNNFDIPVRSGNFTSMDFDRKFDLVIMRGTIEHFVYPIQVLKKVSEITEEGGLVYICATPNGSSFAFDVYRGKWGLFSPDHVHFFSLDHLDSILRGFGFKLLARNYQYEETPYANPIKDFSKIRKDISLIEQGRNDDVVESVPFPGSMISAVWKKTAC